MNNETKKTYTIREYKDGSLTIPKEFLQKLGLKATTKFSFFTGDGCVSILPMNMNATDCLTASNDLFSLSVQLMSSVKNACESCCDEQACYKDLYDSSDADDILALREHLETLPAFTVDTLLSNHVCLMDLLDLLESGEPLEM